MVNTWPGWENAGLIGEGSFGKVYRIRREEFGMVYEAALKVITIPGSQADVRAAYDEGMDEASVTSYFYSFVEDVVAEFALLAQLKGNSNIVSYEDHMVVQHEDEIGWDILIRMELLTPLMQYAAERPLEEGDVIRLGIDLARALELCRKRGIVHRDVKPENIFVSKDGNFKLGDFGVARVAEKTVSAMSRKGTYNYMAPEVYRGQEYGYAADLYSLGLVLYRFLNDNRTPFLPPYPETIRYQDKEKALGDRMRGLPVPPPAHGGKALAEVVLKACEYRPEDRYGDAGEFGTALEALAGGAQVVRQVMPNVGRELGWGEKKEPYAGEASGREEKWLNTDGESGREEGKRPDVGGRPVREEEDWPEERTIAVLGDDGNKRHEDRMEYAPMNRRDTEDGVSAGNNQDNEDMPVYEDNAGENEMDRTLSAFAGDGKGKEPSGRRRPWYQNRLIGAAILPLCILVQCLFPTNSFYGNPVYALFVELHIEKFTGYYYSNVHSNDESAIEANIHGFLLYLCLFLIAAGMAWLWGRIWQEKRRGRIAAGIGIALAAVALFWLRGTLWIMLVVDTSLEFGILAAAVMLGIGLWRGRKGRDSRNRVEMTGKTASLWILAYGIANIISLISTVSCYGWQGYYNGPHAFMSGLEYFLNPAMGRMVLLYIILPLGLGIGGRVFCARRAGKAMADSGR